MPSLRRLLLVFAAFVALPVAAAQPSGLQPLPDIPPPPPMQGDESLEPQITITKRGEDKVEEYRINNKLYMMKVTPAHGGTPYYMIDERGDGTWIRHNITDERLSVPMWVIHTF